jgi:hypothetical protein
MQKWCLPDASVLSSPKSTAPRRLIEAASPDAPCIHDGHRHALDVVESPHGRDSRLESVTRSSALVGWATRFNGLRHSDLSDGPLGRV